MTTPTSDVRAMFERIASTYDRVNRAMTFGLDRGWRSATVNELPASSRSYLDLCAGTLDLAAEVGRRRPGACIAAVDFSRRMLVTGRAKVGKDLRVQAACADVNALPYGTAVFDAALCGFGVRNLPDRGTVLAEVRRILRPGGVLVVLDLFTPERGVARLVHEFHTQTVVPVLGRLLSGDEEAYAYLPDSVDRFVTRPAFEDELRAAGFEDVRGRDVGFGTVSIVRAA